MDTKHGTEFEWNDIYTGDASDYVPPDPLMLEVIDRLQPGRALDLGCGAGGLVAALAERGWEVTGVDIAPRAIEAARKVLAARRLDARLHVADAATWQPPGSYDLVTNSFALPADQARQASVFRVAKRALAPGGTLLIKDFDPSMSDIGPFKDFHLPSIDELLAAFDGLQIVRAEVVDTPVHHHAGEAQRTGRPWTAAFLHACAHSGR